MTNTKSFPHSLLAFCGDFELFCPSQEDSNQSAKVSCSGIVFNWKQGGKKKHHTRRSTQCNFPCAWLQYWSIYQLRKLPYWVAWPVVTQPLPVTWSLHWREREKQKSTFIRHNVHYNFFLLIHLWKHLFFFICFTLPWPLSIVPLEGKEKKLIKLCHWNYAA